MTTTTLRDPDHRCDLPSPRHGQVIRCDECGRTWLGQLPPNPNYWRWVRLTWLGRKLRRLP